ncbi:MAG TPA: flagellar hook-length control protein FliK [Candidatus Deferrimicrobiaceae bacterium]|jgi:hypothetical protein
MTSPAGPGPGAIRGPALQRLVESPQSVLLQAGQTVRFQVLSPGREGGLRIRINGEELPASAQKPLAPGSSGIAVVLDPGQPLRIRIVSLTPPPPSTGSRMPVLLGREPVRGDGISPGALAQFNARLSDAAASGAAPSPRFMQEAILLSRFLASTLVDLPGGKPSMARISKPAPNAAGSQAEPPVRPEGAASPEVETPDAREALAAATPPTADVPFWFFVPFPGEKAPLLFPGYRKRERGEPEATYGLFFRLPDAGSVSVRFRPGGGTWSILFEVEHPQMADLIEAGLPDFSESLRAHGFSLRDAAVTRVRRGALESEFGAMLSRDTGLTLLEERA